MDLEVDKKVWKLMRRLGISRANDKEVYEEKSWKIEARDG